MSTSACRRSSTAGRCRAQKYEDKNASIDALYVTPDKPHQLSLIPNVEFDDTADVKIRTKVDVFYVTRFQKERWAEASEDYPRIDAKFLKASKYAETSVLHPLPRVGELDIALDTDSRALYFRQAAYGVPIRMALIALLTDIARRRGAGALRERLRRRRGRRSTTSRPTSACAASTRTASSTTRRSGNTPATNSSSCIDRRPRPIACAASIAKPTSTDYVAVNTRTRKVLPDEAEIGETIAEGHREPPLFRRPRRRGRTRLRRQDAQQRAPSRSPWLPHGNLRIGSRQNEAEAAQSPWSTI